MALFWTFAEGLVLIYLRWGVLLLKRGEERQKIFLIFCVITFFLLTCLMFGGESFFGLFFDLQTGLNLITYRWALWNFFCTLWVILEGIIMLYVVRLYKTLRPSLNESVSTLTKEKSSTPLSNSSYGIYALISVLISLYVFYEYNLLTMIGENGLDVESIYRISLFYIRICGIFWVLFEWIVAFMGIKTYLLLKGVGESEVVTG